MAERNRAHLKQEFRDGERPTGGDFADLMDSFLCKLDDQISVDPNNNLNIPGGVNLGAPANGNPGTLRFNGGNVQVFNGGVWTNVGGAAGAFIPVGGGPHVAFNGGRVGIGNFGVAPTFKLEVELGNNTAPEDRAKFGNAVLANGNGVFAASAQFSHADHSGGNTNYALRQNAAGEVNLNAPAGQAISITHARTTTRILVNGAGNVIIGNNGPVPGNSNQMFQVNGTAFKLGGGTTWDNVSDVRFKTDIKNFTDGLDKLMQVRPVSFKYDGLPGLDPNAREEVGIIGQEIQQIFPYMVFTTPISDNENPSGKDEVLMYNNNALTYVMVNAIQELASRVKELEARLEAIDKQ